MKKITTGFSVLGMLLFFNACTSTRKVEIVPITTKMEVEDTYTIIWNGKSEAYRYSNGDYVRDETYDYVFNVIQKRYEQQWKSTKTLHRNHPDYDYLAGQRSQSMYFELNYSRIENGLKALLNSSLGKGIANSDVEFREQTIIVDLFPKVTYYNISKFAPYNKIKITQHYKYEEGLLLETVELYKEENGKITPFMKNEEKATFYIKGKLDKAPTIYK